MVGLFFGFVFVFIVYGEIKVAGTALGQYPFRRRRQGTISNGGFSFLKMPLRCLFSKRPLLCLTDWENNCGPGKQLWTDRCMYVMNKCPPTSSLITKALRKNPYSPCGFQSPEIRRIWHVGRDNI